MVKKRKNLRVEKLKFPATELKYFVLSDTFEDLLVQQHLFVSAEYC